MIIIVIVLSKNSRFTVKFNDLNKYIMLNWRRGLWLAYAYFIK